MSIRSHYCNIYHLHSPLLFQMELSEPMNGGESEFSKDSCDVNLIDRKDFSEEIREDLAVKPENPTITPIENFADSFSGSFNTGLSVSLSSSLGSSLTSSLNTSKGKGESQRKSNRGKRKLDSSQQLISSKKSKRYKTG